MEREKMDRNTTLAFILIGAILIIWLYINSPDPETIREPERDTVTTIQDTIEQKELPADRTIEKETEVVQAEGKDLPDFGIYFDPPAGDGRIITIETDFAIYELSTLGANFKKVFLKKFNNWYSLNSDDDEDYYKKSVQLINHSLANAYDISFVSTDGKVINTKNFEFETNAYKSRYVITEQDSLPISFTLKAKNGGLINKNFIFYADKYNIKNEIEFKGMNNLVSNNVYDIVWDSGIRFVEENSVNEANYSNASIYYGDEKVILDASSFDQKGHADFNGRIDWLAVRNKYFAAVIIPHAPANVEGAYVEGYREPRPDEGLVEIYSTRLIIPFRNTDYEKQNFSLFIGPVDYRRLKGLGYNLDALVDFGSFFGLKFIIRPIAEYVLLPLFNFIHLFIPNFGFVIIVFSLIIKIVVYPLTKTSYQSMKKMQLLQPKIAEIKEKYKEDAQKMNKETMKLYQTYGVNPAGGCLPLLLQMPIFIALWGLFQSAIELRQQPFIFWIKDLSNPDVILDLGFKLPMFGIQQISGLALLMGITTFVQQKMTMKDPKQKALVYIMPIMLTILFMTFPSGLNLYYFMFNIFSIAQQSYINHQHSDMVLEPVKNPKKKKGFMSRLMEAAEQQSKAQQKKKK
jgi:YidC/Oxa1 family membrane protein insertase